MSEKLREYYVTVSKDSAKKNNNNNINTTMVTNLLDAHLQYTYSHVS